MQLTVGLLFVLAVQTAGLRHNVADDIVLERQQVHEEKLVGQARKSDEVEKLEPKLERQEVHEVEKLGWSWNPLTWWRSWVGEARKSDEVEKLEPIDFSCAVGGELAQGIGPITEGTGCDNWAPWGLALSGNGLMAEAAAVGTLRSLNDAGILQQLSTISSVSGGSWFNTQFAFSKAFFDGVTQSESLTKWYTEFQGAAMGGYGNPGLATSATWEGLNTGMHKGFDPSTAGLPATNANRKGNTNADLLICIALNGQSLMSDNTTVSQMVTDGKIAFHSNPAFWSVPTSGEGGWTVPGVDLAKTAWTAEGNFQNDFRIILPTPSVTKVSAMSSAAHAITANPELSALFQPNPELSALFQPQDQYAAMFPGMFTGPSSNGVCTTEGDECRFPSMMAMDGCYVDNQGFALNVGYLQKKFPGKNLRLMAVNSELCDRTADPTCIEGVRASAFRSLFAGGPYPAVEFTNPATSPPFGAIVPGPDRTIFRERITDEEALGQQTGFGGMTFTTGTFTTVQNDRFGVAAGTKVAILILNVNGPQYLMPAGDPRTPAHGGADGISDVALHAYKSMNNVLGGYALNKKLTSDEAFLYYQSVKA